MIGNRRGPSVAVDGWACALCTEITNQASWWTANKDLFYCYGCGRGGDVIRFAELYHQVKFSQALTLLRQWRGAEPLLQEAHVSIAFSCIATARRLPICTNAESARRR